MSRGNQSFSNCTSNLLLNCSLNFEPDNISHSNEHDDQKYTFEVGLDVFPIVLAVLIIVINSFVLVLVFKRKALRTVTNYSLCSLAVSDLLTGLVSIPVHLGCNIIRRPVICLAAEIILRFSSVSTVSHLLMVTLDRYLAIIHSLRYGTLVTKRRGFIAIAFIWIMSSFVGLIQLAWLDPAEMDDSPPSTAKKVIIFDIFCLVVYFVFSFVFMVVTYSRIFYEVVRQLRNIKKNSIPGWQETQKHNRREWKAVAMFAVMLLLYVICWLPFFIVRFQYKLGNQFFVLSFVGEYIIVKLRFLNSLFNPCLYIFGKHDFRKALGKTFGRKRRTSYGSELTRTSLLKTSTM